MEQLVNNTW